MVAPSAMTSAFYPVCLRSGVGILTFIDMV
ncbi:MAG: hypothetical protein HW395_276, partial [candidate division NC10 bacterium]|nr:hypothetical protein [candidate division NC10 bacterium]